MFILAAQGYLRGFVAQASGVLGAILAVWVGVVIKQWVGAHWEGAQPAVAFWALRWLVTLLSALAVMSLVQVAGERLGRVVRDGPWGGLDRWSGLVAGAALGIALSSLLVLGAVRVPLPRWVSGGVAGARWSRPLLSMGADACRRAHAVPGSTALRREYLVASRLLKRRNPSI